MTDTDQLIFYLNENKVIETSPDPEESLLHYLRNKLHLTGTKLSCGQGGCGACAVTVAAYDQLRNNVRYYAVNACITPLCSVHGKAVTTVEGLGSTATKPHPVQERLAKCHGSQCGFCTPGMVMSMYSSLKHQPEKTMKDIEDVVSGNLCRCTGYRSIYEGFKTFAKGCIVDASYQTYNPDEDAKFPEELKEDKFHSKQLVFMSDKTAWWKPCSLEELLALKGRYPEAPLAGGFSTLVMRQRFGGQIFPVVLDVNQVVELRQVHVQKQGVQLGSALSFTQVMEILQDILPQLTEVAARGVKAMLTSMHKFGGQQVRNIASIGGSLFTASATSDLNILLMAAGSAVNMISTDGNQRQIVLDEGFFVKKGQCVISKEEVVTSVFLPFTDQNSYYAAEKQTERFGADSTVVNSAMKVQFEPNSNIVEDFNMFLGGYKDTIISAKETKKLIHGRKWDSSLLRIARESLMKECGTNALSDEREAYKSTWAADIFIKFYVAVREQYTNQQGLVGAGDQQSNAAKLSVECPALASTQVTQDVPADQSQDDALGRPLPHHWAIQQATGEALYCDDIPQQSGELHLALVLSNKAHAKIIGVDASAALQLPGVVRYVGHQDVPGDNVCGVTLDEVLFAEELVHFHGAMVGAIVAASKDIADKASLLVKVAYEELHPILTIQEAIGKASFIEFPKMLQNGDVMSALASSDSVIEGQVYLGGQEHFYMEPQSCIVTPKEGRDLDIVSSTQALADVQVWVSRALGMPSHRIVVRAKRLGGAFGGKCDTSARIAAATAVAATVLNRPVRCCLSRFVDMTIKGTSQPHYCEYKVGFTKRGKIQAVDMKVYANAGYSCAGSGKMLQKFLYHMFGAYRVRHFRADVRLCRTNIHSVTAFRGFGAPEAHFIAEAWMEHVATSLALDPATVKQVNLYMEGDLDHLDNKLTDCAVRRCWDEVINSSQYYRRRKAVQDFNSENIMKKRGLSITPVKRGNGFCSKILNHGHATVHIYKDGTVLVNHGGIEMGQGLHTKMMQVASRALQVPIEKIYNAESRTDIIANTAATGASTGSDFNGMAIMLACEKLKKRMLPFKEKNPDYNWEQLVMATYHGCVSLSTSAYYHQKRPPATDVVNKQHGPAMRDASDLYYTYGAAVSEVELDCLTGEHVVLRTDIVMDVGKSLNPAIDIGQIEGGFVQFYGRMTSENIRHAPDGRLLTTGPGNYKIPTLSNIPRQFNVTLLKDSSNVHAVYSSKAIGEPPLTSAISVHSALKDAIASARMHNTEIGGDVHFRLDAPATLDRIKEACGNSNLSKFLIDA